MTSEQKFKAIKDRRVFWLDLLGCLCEGIAKELDGDVVLLEIKEYSNGWKKGEADVMIDNLYLSIDALRKDLIKTMSTKADYPENAIYLEKEKTQK